MQRISQEPIIIDLDDPAPRWFRCCGVLAGLTFVALLIAPWAINTEAEPGVTEVRAPSSQSVEYAAICQPSIDLPAFAEPAVSVAMPSWMRLCDWFAEPAGHLPGALPTPPPSAPHFQD